MNSLKKNISYQLKKFRRLNGLSQERAAEQLGISTLFLGELERGKRLPSTTMLVRIYSHMECTEIPLRENYENEDSLPDDAQKLINLIKVHPELADTLLKIANNLLK